MNLKCGCQSEYDCNCTEMAATHGGLNPNVGRVMDKTEIQEIKNIFDSIICLAVEGPDATSIRAVINQIIRQAGHGYNLCDCHLTSHDQAETHRT